MIFVGSGHCAAGSARTQRSMLCFENFYFIPRWRGLHKKGENHKWGFPIFSPMEKIHPFRALMKDKGVSSPAGDEEGYAPSSARAFWKKLAKNLHSVLRADALHQQIDYAC